jgi:hypothetical protein
MIVLEQEDKSGFAGGQVAVHAVRCGRELPPAVTAVATYGGAARHSSAIGYWHCFQVG